MDDNGREEYALLGFLATLSELVRTQPPVRFPFRESVLAYDTVRGAVAERFTDWRNLLAELHKKGFTMDPESFRTMRVVSGDEVADVVTEAGRRALANGRTEVKRKDAELEAQYRRVKRQLENVDAKRDKLLAELKRLEGLMRDG